MHINGLCMLVSGVDCIIIGHLLCNINATYCIHLQLKICCRCHIKSDIVEKKCQWFFPSPLWLVTFVAYPTFEIFPSLFRLRMSLLDISIFCSLHQLCWVYTNALIPSWTVGQRNITCCSLRYSSTCSVNQYCGDSVSLIVKLMLIFNKLYRLIKFLTDCS